MNRILAIAAACTAAISSPSVAAPGTQAKGQQLFDLAQCLVRQAPRQSEELMRAPFDTAEEKRDASVLVSAHPGCIQGHVVSGRTGEIRGAVAQALFARDTALLEDLAASPVTQPVRATAGEGLREFLVAYGACLVGAEPAQSAALLRTPLGSAEERGAFLAYGDALKACMPEGVTYTVNVPDMRNQIAAVAWRRAAHLDGNG